MLLPWRAHSSVNLLTVSSEWIPQHIITYRFGSGSVGAEASGYPRSPLWENRGGKKKVVWRRQMKGFEASGEKCVYLLSPVTSPSALWPSSWQASSGRFITALVLHIWSFAEFCFLEILLLVYCYFTLSFPSQWLWLKFIHSVVIYPPWLWTLPPMLPASLPIVSPRTVHSLPKEGPHSSPRHAPGPTSWAHVAYILDRVAFWQLHGLHLAPELCFVWPHSVLS